MEQIESFLKHWPRAALCMLIGGLIGLIVWMFIPQQYTASVRLNISIDYNRTGKLDDLEEERVIGVVEDILHSDSVMETVYRESGMEDYRSFYDKTQITRTNDDWRLSLRNNDPEKAGKLALLWLDTAHEALYDHMSHAVRAEALQNELEGLTRCIQNSGNAGFTAVCGADPEALRRDIDTLTGQILTENKAAGGLSTAILIGEMNPKQLGIRPSSITAAAGALLGTFCGLLAAFALVWLPRREQE